MTVFTHGEIWSDGAGGAELVPATATATATVQMPSAGPLWLAATISGTAADKIVVEVEHKIETTWTPLPLAARVGTGGRSTYSNQIELPGSGGPHGVRVELPPWAECRFKIYRVGGDGTTAALILARQREPYDTGIPFIEELPSEYEVVADATAQGNGTTYYYVDMQGFGRSATMLVITAGSGTVTVTLEATVQDDGTAPASCTYAVATEAVFNVASFTASDIAIDDAGKMACFRYVRWKVVRGGSGSDSAWEITCRKVK